MASGNIVVYILIGAVLGFILGRLTKGSSKQTEIKTELDKTKSELDQYKQELVDHFSSSAELLENIFRDYNSLCQKMAKTSSELFPNQNENENPFAKRLTHSLTNEVQAESIELQEAPRDYSETSSGLLKTEEETIVTANKEEKASKEEKKEISEKID